MFVIENILKYTIPDSGTEFQDSHFIIIIAEWVDRKKE